MAGMTALEDAAREYERKHGYALKPRDIVGNAEARKLCGGVTRATLIAWRKTAGFPAPVRKLESGEIWDARQVREWWRRRNSP